MESTQPLHKTSVVTTSLKLEAIQNIWQLLTGIWAFVAYIEVRQRWSIYTEQFDVRDGRHPDVLFNTTVPQIVILWFWASVPVFYSKTLIVVLWGLAQNWVIGWNPIFCFFPPSPHTHPNYFKPPPIYASFRKWKPFQFTIIPQFVISTSTADSPLLNSLITLKVLLLFHTNTFC